MYSPALLAGLEWCYSFLPLFSTMLNPLILQESTKKNYNNQDSDVWPEFLGYINLTHNWSSTRRFAIHLAFHSYPKRRTSEAEDHTGDLMSQELTEEEQI